MKFTTHNRFLLFLIIITIFIFVNVSFADPINGSKAYLFVFDSFDNHNAAGYEVSLTEEQSSICGEADTNQDNIISDSEMQSYTDRWLLSIMDVTLQDLMTAMRERKNGC